MQQMNPIIVGAGACKETAKLLKKIAVKKP